MNRISKAEREFVLAMQRKTNGDRIRSMSDEELAKWIAGGVLNLNGGALEMATRAWLGWLKQEGK